MSGSVPLRHEYAFMAWTGTTLPSWLGQAQLYLYPGRFRSEKASFEIPANYKTNFLKFQCFTVHFSTQ